MFENGSRMKALENAVNCTSIQEERRRFLGQI